MSEVNKAKQAAEQEAEQKATLEVLTKAIAEPILKEVNAIKEEVTNLQKAETNVDVHSSKGTKSIEPETTDTGVEKKANTISNDEVRKATDTKDDKEDDDEEENPMVSKATDSDDDKNDDEDKSDSEEENDADDKLMADVSKAVQDLLAKGDVTKAHGLLASHLSKAKAENKASVASQAGSQSITNKAKGVSPAINKSTTSTEGSGHAGYNAFRGVMDDIYKNVKATDVNDLTN